MFNAIRNEPQVKVKLKGPCPVINMGMQKGGSILSVPNSEAVRLVEWGLADLCEGERFHPPAYMTR